MPFHEGRHHNGVPPAQAPQLVIRPWRYSTLNIEPGHPEQSHSFQPNGSLRRIRRRRSSDGLPFVTVEVPKVDVRNVNIGEGKSFRARVRSDSKLKRKLSLPELAPVEEEEEDWFAYPIDESPRESDSVSTLSSQTVEEEGLSMRSKSESSLVSQLSSPDVAQINAKDEKEPDWFAYPSAAEFAAVGNFQPQSPVPSHSRAGLLEPFPLFCPEFVDRKPVTLPLALQESLSFRPEDANGNETDSQKHQDERRTDRPFYDWSLPECLRLGRPPAEYEAVSARNVRPEIQATCAPIFLPEVTLSSPLGTPLDVGFWPEPLHVRKKPPVDAAPAVPAERPQSEVKTPLQSLVDSPKIPLSDQSSVAKQQPGRTIPDKVDFIGYNPCRSPDSSLRPHVEAILNPDDGPVHEFTAHHPSHEPDNSAVPTRRPNPRSFLRGGPYPQDHTTIPESLVVGQRRPTAVAITRFPQRIGDDWL